jgi:hypothetical protein
MIDAGAFVGLPSSGASWDTTAKTSNFTAVSGNGYFVNTTSAAITVTLPSSPSAGDIVALQDYAGTWGTNNVTVARNGSDIGGIAADATLSVSNQSITLVYVDATRGWQTVSDSTQNIDGRSYIVATGGTISTCGDYKVHSFYGPGTFTVCSVGTTPGNNVVDYLVVAGGGMGGKTATTSTGGGGGAGGYRESSGVATGNYSASPLGACVSALPVSATSYPVTVGAGGLGSGGSSGSNSVFSSITSAGGGGGGSGASAPQLAKSGGSGGGGSSATAHPSYSAPQKRGSGNTPPVSPPQGNNGGEGREINPTALGSGGGGGAGAVGENGTPHPTGCGSAGPGGDGLESSINGSTIMRAGGGGGSAKSGNYPSTKSGTGGAGGGGLGGYVGQQGDFNGENAVENTGSGGGGSNWELAGRGGSGIVIIRYKYK